MNSVVYMLQEPLPFRDVTSAYKYGRIVSIFRSEITPSLTPERTYERLFQVLRNYRPGVDYICNPGGDPTLPLLAGIILACLNIDHITYLRWDRIKGDLDRRNGVYTPVIIPLPEYEDRENAA